METKLLFYTQKNYFPPKLTKIFNKDAKCLKSIIVRYNVTKIIDCGVKCKYPIVKTGCKVYLYLDNISSLLICTLASPIVPHRNDIDRMIKYIWSFLVLLRYKIESLGQCHTWLPLIATFVFDLHTWLICMGMLIKAIMNRISNYISAA